MPKSLAVPPRDDEALHGSGECTGSRIRVVEQLEPEGAQSQVAGDSLVYARSVAC